MQETGNSTTYGHPTPQPRGKLRKLLTVLLVAINISIAGMTVLASYGGMANSDITVIPAMAAMTLPIWLAATIAITIADLISVRRLTLIPIATLVICAAPIWDYCPLNIFKSQPPTPGQDGMLTLLTYNVYNFNAHNGVYPDSTNASASFIIGSGADIVAIQEAYHVNHDMRICFTPEQADSIAQIYPYRISDSNAMTLLSKYPATELDLSGSLDKYDQIAAYDIDVNGMPLRLYNVHMQSFQLNQDDKNLYSGITRLNGNETYQEVKQQLLGKFAKAYKERAVQARALLAYMESNPAENVIVCGDFNDIPDSYSMRTICRDGLKQVYPRVGIGPMITYNSDRFLFRIDHILYKGDIEPCAMTRGSLRSSDHFPLLATFKAGK